MSCPDTGESGETYDVEMANIHQENCLCRHCEEAREREADEYAARNSVSPQ